ncbi:DUF6461 domain-containing protein [Streptomyces sp. NRRL B-3229]|uniref:DUF6461 domain-containing protein n=1 Tax=Streptomyces sp. NRRL B-3229 TaxID=1463836 RepID=UPI0004BFCF44|nr:DUF6461 domain-containing protein [Streptomyces sp. NRRL B-3229]
MTGMTTATDYAWLEDGYELLMEAYCLTLVRGLTPAELLRELGAEGGQRITGVDALGEPSYEVHTPFQLFVGATAIRDWTLMVECNGYLGVTDEAMLPLSRGRRIVSHFLNVNAVDRFCWYEDGDLRLHFEPLFADTRYGSHPDELVAEMRESGFDLSERDEDDDNDYYASLTGASFALAHRLTGIRLTPELFAGAEFLCGVAPVPRG